MAESFLSRLCKERIARTVLACMLKDALVKHSIDFQDCCGQGYEGAPNISTTGGVQDCLKAEDSKSVYIHCNSRILRLCFGQICNL